MSVRIMLDTWGWDIICPRCEAEFGVETSYLDIEEDMPCPRCGIMMRVKVHTITTYEAEEVETC